MMKMQIIDMVRKATEPSNRKGPPARPMSIASRIAASRRLRGKSSESSARNMVLLLDPDHRNQALRPPHQHRHQQADGSNAGQRRDQVADVQVKQARSEER